MCLGKVSWPEAKLGVIDSSRLLSTIVMNLYPYKVTRPVVRELQVAAIHPLQIWMHPLGFCKNIKDKLSDRPNENHATPYRIHLLPLLTAATGNN